MSLLRPFLSSAIALALPLAAAQAQNGEAMAAAPVAGTIMGAGGHMAAGNIHVVGAMGAQRIHFTGAFKTEGGKDLHAILSTDMMAGEGAVDLGAVKAAGEQYVQVPATVDVTKFAELLIYDRKSKTVVASTPVPGGMHHDGMMGKHDGMMGKDDKMGKHDGMMGGMKDTSMAMPMKKDSSMSKPN